MQTKVTPNLPEMRNLAGRQAAIFAVGMQGVVVSGVPHHDMGAGGVTSSTLGAPEDHGLPGGYRNLSSFRETYSRVRRRKAPATLSPAARSFSIFPTPPWRSIT